MEHIGKGEDKGLFDQIQFSERELAFVELAVAQTGVEDITDQVCDADRCRLFERT